jgi:aspartyl protease family protein
MIWHRRLGFEDLAIEDSAIEDLASKTRHRRFGVEDLEFKLSGPASMRPVIIFALLALAAAVIVPHMLQQSTVLPAPAAVSAHQAMPVEPAPSNSRSVVVPPDRDGHFRVEGHVDGRRLNFMVDTGASVIALTEQDAAMLGLHPAQREFTSQVRTANGTVNAAPVRLDRVEIGDVTVRDVSALVLPDGALTDNLLGLSFLSRLHHFEYASGKLVLEQ